VLLFGNGPQNLSLGSACGCSRYSFAESVVIDDCSGKRGARFIGWNMFGGVGHSRIIRAPEAGNVMASIIDVF